MSVDASKAPERIWADRVSDEIKGWVDWTEGDWTATPYDGYIEYVRADLYYDALAVAPQPAPAPADERDEMIEVILGAIKMVFSANPYPSLEGTIADALLAASWTRGGDAAILICDHCNEPQDLRYLECTECGKCGDVCAAPRPSISKAQGDS